MATVGGRLGGKIMNRFGMLLARPAMSLMRPASPASVDTWSYLLSTSPNGSIVNGWDTNAFIEQQ
jgi:hypothetical protein